MFTCIFLPLSTPYLTPSRKQGYLLLLCSCWDYIYPKVEGKKEDYNFVSLFVVTA